MKYINKKQKILLIIIISIITLGISYYAYAYKTNDEFNVNEQNLEVGENETESSEETEENNQDLGRIVVHVSGAVNNEGVFDLEENARVADAVEAAGGVTENAYMKDVNLAEPLEDGMKVYIPTKEEVEKQNQGESTNYISGTSSSNNTSSSTQRSVASKTGINNNNSKVNINTASIEELDTLPGIGETTANKIINYRNENGKFKSIEEIKEVSGIGDSKYEQIKDLIEI